MAPIQQRSHSCFSVPSHRVHPGGDDHLHTSKSATYPAELSFNDYYAEQGTPSATSTSTATAPPVPPPIVGAERATKWKSIYLSGLMTFMSSVQFSLYFSSLWPFMREIDPTTSETYFGLVIATYSFSQIIASPLLGYWSNRIQRLKFPLIVCAVFMAIGNATYFSVELFPGGRKHWLMFARFVTGLGGGNIGLLKAYASMASVPKDRMRAIAYVSGGVALGLTCGPAFQVMFSGLGYPGYAITSSFSLSMFNAPALFAVLMNVVNLFLLHFFFKESFVGVLEKLKHQPLSKDAEQSSATSSTSSVGVELPPYDRWAAASCCCLRFTQMFVFTNLETIGSSFEMMMFAWGTEEVVKYSSFAHLGRGLFAFAVYLVYIVTDIGKRINERMVCLVSLLGLLIYHFVTYSWPFLPNRVTVYNGSALPANSSLAVGCNIEEYPWCDGLTQVNLILYYSFYVLLVGVCFPNINVTMNSLFSKIIGPRLQGTQQGMFLAYEGSAKMVGPLLIGWLYTRNGPRIVWVVEMVVVGAMIGLWVLRYKRLVPLPVPTAAQLPVPSRRLQQKRLEAKVDEEISNASLGCICSLSYNHQHHFDRIRSASVPVGQGQKGIVLEVGKKMGVNGERF